MRYLATITASLCVLVLGALALRSPGRAQAAAVKDGQDAAQAAFDAWYAGDFEKFHAMLAADVRGTIALQNLAMRKRLTAKELGDGEFSVALMARLALLDPEGRLQLTTPEKLNSLTDAQFFGLASGILAVSYQLRQKPLDRWVLVDYEQGIRPPRGALRKGSSSDAVCGATAEFESVAGNTIRVWLVQDGAWHVDAFTLSDGKREVDLAAFLKDGASYDVRWPGVSPADDRLWAGQDLIKRVLQAGRDSYNENGSSSEAEEKMNEAGKTTGPDYELAVVKTGFGRQGDGAAVIVRPKTDGDPWLVTASGFRAGEPNILECPTEEAAKQMLARLTKQKPAGAQPEQAPEPRKFR